MAFSTFMQPAPLVPEIPPAYAGESRAQHRSRSIRWRAFAADPTPDTWFLTADEYKALLRWVRAACHPTPQWAR